MNFPATRSIQLLGVHVHDVTMDECCKHVEAAIARGGAWRIATVNPEFVMIAQRNAEFFNALRSALVCTPDGVGILWAARWLGGPLRERVTGVDLSERLCALAAQRGWRMFLLGAGPGVAERTADIWRARYPGLTVAGTHAGTPSDADAPEILARVRTARANIVLVAYGAPAQDLWLARHLNALRGAASEGVVGIGVGGVFDYVAGVRPLAPRWMRRIGLEWLFRLVNQPARWRRQLDLLRFVVAIVGGRGDRSAT
jgi:N-acetylglucosaminyldiphosphoundecaprenol N-acetyl-beta-D-mannosaminyltransferase